MDYMLVIFVGIIGVFYYNTLRWLVESWTYNPYYSHGFLVPIIAGYIIWGMRKELKETKKEQSNIGLIILFLGLILHGIASFEVIRFLSGLSIIITITGIIYYLYGYELINKIKFPIAFLLFAIPLPFIDIMAPPTQTFSAIASANVANLIGINVQREGFQLIASSGVFEVALECSGMRSIISLLTIGTIYAFVLEGKRIMKFTIILSVIPLALMGNVLRIVSTIAISNKYGQETAMNYFHDFSSLLLFSIALMGLFLVGRSFGRLKFKNIF